MQIHLIQIESLHGLLSFQWDFVTFIFRINFLGTQALYRPFAQEWTLYLTYSFSMIIIQCQLFKNLLTEWLTLPYPAVLSCSGIWECLLGASRLHRDEVHLCTLLDVLFPMFSFYMETKFTFLVKWVLWKSSRSLFIEAIKKMLLLCSLTMIFYPSQQFRLAVSLPKSIVTEGNAPEHELRMT